MAGFIFLRVLKNLKRSYESLEIARIIKKNPVFYIKLVLWGILLWLVLFAISAAASFLARKLIPINADFSVRFIAGLIMLLSFLLVPTFVYSFFKVIILSRISLFFSGKKSTTTLFWRFYLSNIVILVLINIIFGAWLLIGSGVKTAILTFVPIAFFEYSFTNIFHSMLIQRGNQPIVREAFKFTFQIRRYIGFIVPDIVILAVFLFGWYILSRLLFQSNITAYPAQGYIQGYNTFFAVFFYLALVAVCAFNQIYFYKKVAGKMPG